MRSIKTANKHLVLFCLFWFSSPAVFCDYHLSGPVRDHLAVIVLIKKEIIINDTGTSIHESQFHYIDDGYGTRSELIMTAHSATKLRSYLRGNGSKASEENSSTTQSVIKIFTANEVSGVAYLETFPEELASHSWLPDELVRIPLKNSGLFPNFSG